MSEFFNMISTLFVCGTLLGLTMLVLMSLPNSKLRSAGLEFTKYAVAAFLAFLVVSPWDLIPDIPVVGWGDDLAYIWGAVKSVKSAREDGKNRGMYAEIERNELQARTKDTRFTTVNKDAAA